MTKLKDLDDTALEKYLLDRINQTRLIEAEILLILSEVKNRDLVQRQGFTSLSSFCESRLGLSKDQSWRRSQATAVIEVAPEALSLLRNGKTHISNLAMLAPKITLNNKEVILDFLPGASKADLAFFLQTIDKEGNKVAVEPTVTLKLRVSREMLEKLEKLQGLLVQSQSRAKKPSNKETTIERAVDALLEKIDPIKKQQRRENRKSVDKVGSVAESQFENQLQTRLTTPSTTAPATKRNLPEALKAEVLKRDGYRCTHNNIFGERCEERTVLQIDHIKPWAMGGSHDVWNLRTFCRSHNLMMADVAFGKKFMTDKKSSGVTADFPLAN